MGSLIKIIYTYFSNDDKKVGFTACKAAFNSLGLSWWSKPSIWRTLLTPVSLVLTVFHTYAEVAYAANIKIISPRHFLELMRCTIFIQTTSLTSFKIFLLHWFRKRYKGTIDAIEQLQVERKIKSNNGLSGKILRFYTGTVVFTACGCLLYGTLKKHFPAKVKYPLLMNPKFRMGPSIAWIIQALMCLYASAGNCAPDSVLLLVVNVLENFGAELIMIMRKIGENPEEDDGLLREATTVHSAIIRLANDAKMTFRFNFLLQLVYIVVHACFILFTISKAQDFALALSSLVPILIAAFLQLFVYCHAGQALTDMSEGVTFSAYDNQWYNSSIATRKKLLIFQEVCKHTLAIDSYSIVRASYQTCLNTIRESFSYYIVLKTFESEL